MDFVQGYGAEDDAEGGSQEIELDVFVNHLTGDIDVRQQGAEEEERRDALAGTTCAAPTSAPPRAPKASQCEVRHSALSTATQPFFLLRKGSGHQNDPLAFVLANP